MTLSTHYCCPVCYDAVAITETPAGAPVYECTNPHCRKTVSVGCAEDALVKIEDVTLKLTKKVKVAA